MVVHKRIILFVLYLPFLFFPLYSQADALLHEKSFIVVWSANIYSVEKHYFQIPYRKRKGAKRWNMHHHIWNKFYNFPGIFLYFTQTVNKYYYIFTYDSNLRYLRKFSLVIETVSLQNNFWPRNSIYAIQIIRISYLFVVCQGNILTSCLNFCTAKKYYLHIVKYFEVYIFELNSGSMMFFKKLIVFICCII